VRNRHALISGWKNNVARTRTTKKLAQRIDLNYFKRSTPLKRAKLWLSLLVPVLAIMWIFWHGFHKDARVYSSGRMSAPHAILEKQCASCHVQKASIFSAKVQNQACLSCHDGPSIAAALILPPPAKNRARNVTAIYKPLARLHVTRNTSTI
jgi:hypothetical protein